MKFLCPPTNLSPLELSIKEYFQCQKTVDILRSNLAPTKAETALIEALLAADKIIHGGKK